MISVMTEQGTSDGRHLANFAYVFLDFRPSGLAVSPAPKPSPRAEYPAPVENFKPDIFPIIMRTDVPRLAPHSKGPGCKVEVPEHVYFLQGVVTPPKGFHEDRPF